MIYRDVDNTGQCSPQVYGTRTAAPHGLLVHTTAGTSSLAWLLGGSALAGSPASADYLIDRDGTRHHIVPNGHYAYHAGVISPHAPGGNQYFIGVELEALSTEVVTLQETDSLAELLAFVVGPQFAWRFPFVIYGHYGIAAPVGRRSDPYLFDWGGFFGRLLSHCRAAETPGL